MSARLQRDQIVAAMSHCNVNVWAYSKADTKLTMLEGAYMRSARIKEGFENADPDPNAVVWDDVSNREELKKAAEDVLAGTRPNAEVECKIGGQWNKASAFQHVADHDSDLYRFASYQNLPE